ncbi:hypothetical protein CHARACLAT_008554 [Characodon lateralis]|uniref:Uncharacterized protein n=1 Tax=Characodon lateralis TaxID=208331 RepID=A0ABU7DET7_9TELE|nr:hypothetical protein [Characodon lateralis]
MKVCSARSSSSPFGCCPQGLPQQITCLYLAYHLPLQLKNLPFKSSSFPPSLQLHLQHPLSNVSTSLFRKCPIQLNIASLTISKPPNLSCSSDLRLSNLVHSGHSQ